MELIADIRLIYDNYDFATQILVASVRHPIHVVEAAKIRRRRDDRAAQDHPPAVQASADRCRHQKLPRRLGEDRSAHLAEKSEKQP